MEKLIELFFQFVVQKIFKGDFWPFKKNKYIQYTDIRPLAIEMGLDIDGRYAPQSNNAYALEGALREAAVLEILTVYGRERGVGNMPRVPIPAEHFRDYEFAHGFLGKDYPNKGTHTCTSGMQTETDDSFHDLHVNKSELRKVLRKHKKQNR